jgi:hypothetical protein
MTLPVKPTLARAHCSLGKVATVRAKGVGKDSLSQKPRFGAVLPQGGKVSVSSRRPVMRRRRPALLPHALRDRARPGCHGCAGRLDSGVSPPKAYKTAQEPPVVAGDLNGDHKPDLVTNYRGTESRCFNRGNGTFRSKASTRRHRTPTQWRSAT